MRVVQNSPVPTPIKYDLRPTEQLCSIEHLRANEPTSGIAGDSDPHKSGKTGVKTAST